jgi:ribonucleoside-triphosphate reductase
MAIDFGGLSDEVAQAHKDMLCYQHDLEKAVYGVHNCLNINFNELFKNGFRTRNGDVRPPKSLSTALQHVAVGFQCQSQVQFGGVGSIHLDYDLAPYVRMSFLKHFMDGLKYVEDEDVFNGTRQI